MSLFPEMFQNISLTRILKTFLPYWIFTEQESFIQLDLDVLSVSYLLYFLHLFISFTLGHLVFEKDLDYWNIDPYSLGEKLRNIIYIICYYIVFILEACCALKYFPEVDVRQNEKDMDLKAKIKAMETAEEEDFGSSSVRYV